MTNRSEYRSLRSRHILLAAVAAVSSSLPVAWAQTASTAWTEFEKAATLQTVAFNARAGSERTNACIQWAVREVLATHGVRREHVKIADAAHAAATARPLMAALPPLAAAVLAISAEFDASAWQALTQSGDAHWPAA